jgi:glycerophosphoryl diester phosphodiesterase
LVVAHRGFTKSAPENSIAALEAAIAIGCDAVETDVRCTADQVFVLHHDPAMNGQPIAKTKYEGLPEENRPPRLQDFLETAKGRIKLDIELKVAGFEEEILRLIVDQLGVHDYVITSFHDPTVAMVKAISPPVQAGLIFGSPRIQLNPQNLFPFARLSKCQADFLAPHYTLANLGLIGRAAKRNLPVMLWTVNSPRAMKAARQDPRVKAIVTDHPDELLKLQP